MPALGKRIFGRDVDDDITCEGVPTNMTDHTDIPPLVFIVPLEFAVEEGTEDTASHVSAAVAADEDGGLGDWYGLGEVWWRIWDSVRAEGLVAEVGRGEVGSVGEGVGDVREVEEMWEELEGGGRFRGSAVWI